MFQQLFSRIKSVPSGYWMGVFLVFYGIYYGYPNILPLEPQSLHKWRQSDCAAWIWQYYAEGNSFWEPEMNNRLGNGTGKIVAEFPLLYYLSAQLYHLFGPYAWVFRTLSLLLVGLGLGSLHRALYKVLGSGFWSVALVLLVFSSPTLVFFSITSIPDASAFGVAMVGVYAFSSYVTSRKIRYLIGALTAFALAAMLKISMAIPMLVTLGVCIWEGFVPISRWKIPTSSRLFGTYHGRYLAMYGVGIALIWGWYTFASWYSTGSLWGHFGDVVQAIWGMEGKEIGERVGLFIQNDWRFLYYFPTNLLLFFLLIIGILLKGPHLQQRRLIIFLTILGCISYSLLFFQLLLGHEYYHIANLFGVIVLLANGAFLLKHLYSKFYDSPWTKGIMVAFLALNLYHAKMEMQARYYNNWGHYREKEVLYQEGFRHFLGSKGISADKKVMSIPDFSPNNTLYLMRRKGWTSFNNPRHEASIIKDLTQNYGLEYLIVSDSALLKEPQLIPVLDSLVGEYEGIRVYKTYK